MLDYKEFTNKIKKAKHPEENEMHNSMYIILKSQIACYRQITYISV